MVKKITNWLNSHLDYEEGKACRSIFNDSIKCYINNIPRAAMQLSYVAFLNSMREKFLSLSQSATGLSPNDFTDFQNKLQDDEHFEPFVAGLLDNTGEARFRFSHYPDALTKDFNYWRRIRNDCAHYKNNAITNATVECFWNFLIYKSHLFEPLGYIERIIDEYNDFFNPSLTAPGSDDSRLFSMLINSIKSKDDVSKFFSNLSCDPKYKYDLINRIGHSSDVFRNYIKTLINDGVFIWLDFFRACPDEITYYFGDDDQKLREFWYSKSTMANYSFIKTLICIYNSGLIQDDVKNEFFEKFMEFLLRNQLEFSWERNNEILTFIKTNTIIKNLFLNKYLCSYNFANCYEEVNYHDCFYIKFLQLYTLNDEMSVALALAFSEDNSPWRLRSIIKGQFTSNTNGFNTTAFKTVLSQHGITDPFGL